MQATPSYSAIFFAISSAVLMGTVGVFSKLSGMGAETITFFRLFTGACFMFLFLFCKGDIRLLLQRPSFAVICNGFFLAGFIIFYVQAMNYTTMANAIMIIYFAPLTAAVYAHFFMQEKLKPFSLFLICLAILGFAMMLEFKLDIHGDRNRLIGLALATVGMFCYSAFILINRKITDHVYTSTFYQLLIGGAAMAPLFFINLSPISTQQWLLLLGTGFFPGFLAILMAVIALRKLQAAAFGTLAYFEPLAVVLFGWLIFQESLSVLQIAGCCLILLCGILKTASN
ncbi:MAG: DMT family transporter [Desulfopila sp.]|jgi:drug/metabolite transporter (DMT)-like permease|nr:DMT family transporter [Desulfopila sp.]